MENVELTPEEKKAKAAEAKKEAAAKAEAERQQKEKDAESKKQQAEQQKVVDVTNAVTAEFNTLQGHVNNGKTLLSNLVAESTVEQIQTAGDQAAETLKSAKASLKAIKTQVKKLKEPGDLSVAQSTAEKLVAELDDAVKGVKTKVSDAKKAAKDAEKAEEKRLKEEQKAKNAMPNQNGITRPRPDTACGNAWALMDQLSEKLKQPVPISILLQAAEQKNLNYDTVKTQYARWKKFNGIEGRVAVPLPTGILD